MKKKKPGILLNPAHQPVKLTVIVAENRGDISLFCQACQVSPRNRHIIHVPLTGNSVLNLRGVYDFEIVFLGCDPRHPRLISQETVWATLDHCLACGYVTSARIYNEWSHHSIEPQVLGEEAREW